MFRYLVGWILGVIVISGLVACAASEQYSCEEVKEREKSYIECMRMQNCVVSGSEWANLNKQRERACK